MCCCCFFRPLFLRSHFWLGPIVVVVDVSPAFHMLIAMKDLLSVWLYECVWTNDFSPLRLHTNFQPIYTSIGESEILRAVAGSIGSLPFIWIALWFNYIAILRHTVPSGWSPASLFNNGFRTTLMLSVNSAHIRFPPDIGNAMVIVMAPTIAVGDNSNEAPHTILLHSLEPT